jgi:hypothetical protein
MILVRGSDAPFSYHQHTLFTHEADDNTLNGVHLPIHVSRMSHTRLTSIMYVYMDVYIYKIMHVETRQ